MNHLCKGVLGVSLVLLTAIASAAPVAVKVVDRPLEEPVANAEITINVNGVKTVGTSDGDGALTLELPAAKGRTTITAKANGFAIYNRYVNDAAQVTGSAPLQIQLEPAITVGGKVVDEAGKPIAGANVVVSISKRSGDPSGVERTSSGVSYETVRTDAEGKWTCAGVPAEFDRANVGCWHHGFASTFSNDAGSYSMGECKDDAALKAQSAVMTLKRGNRVQGIVRDKDGKPLANAQVGIGRDRVASNALPPVRTNAAGQFTIAAHPTGELPITVKASGHAPELIKVMMASADQKVEIDLKPATQITGRVLDPEGKPVPQAMVFVDTWRECRTINARLRTDANGRFTWNDAPADSVIADVDSQKFARLSNVTLKPGEENTVTLLRPAVVRGVVLDDQTNQPITPFKVVPGIGFEGEGQRILWQRDERGEGMKLRTDGTFEATIRWTYPKHAMRVEAEGYLPEDSPTFKISDGNQSFTFRMKKGQNIAGTVTDPTGTPLADARVFLVTPSTQIQVSNGEVPEHAVRDALSAKTDAIGHFSLPPQAETFMLLVTHPSGYAQVNKPDFSDVLKLQPWGAIEGEVSKAGQPSAGQEIGVHQIGEGSDERAPRVHYRYTARTDAQGRFKLDRVPAGKWSVARATRLGNTTSYGNGVRIEVQPGATTPVQVGSKGRPVIGKVQIPEELAKRSDWQFQPASISTDMPLVRSKFSLSTEGMTREQIRIAYQEWSKTDEGKAYVAEMTRQNALRRHYSVHVERDGNFRSEEEVEAGRYRITFYAMAEADRKRNVWTPMASANAKFTMEEIPGGYSETPVELPAVELVVHRTIDVGQPLPDFQAKGFDDKPITLVEYRGKYVALVFRSSWATAPTHMKEDLAALAELHKQSQADPRLAMLSLNIDESIEDARAFVEKNAIAWPQGYLGGLQDQTVTRAYGVNEFPSYWLISPDGIVLAKAPRAAALRDEIAKHVK